MNTGTATFEKIKSLLTRLWWWLGLNVLLSISIIDENWGLSWVIKKAMPCEGFGCVGVGIVMMGVLMVITPLILTVWGIWYLVKYQQVHVWEGALGCGCFVLFMALCSVTVRIQVQQHKDKITLEQYEQEQQKARNGVDDARVVGAGRLNGENLKERSDGGVVPMGSKTKAQAACVNKCPIQGIELQTLPLLDSRRPIAILNVLEHSVLQSHLPKYGEVSKGVYPNNAALGGAFSGNTEQPWSIHVQVGNEYWMSESDPFVRIELVYFEDAVRKQRVLGEAKKKFCLDEHKCIGVLTLSAQQVQQIRGKQPKGSVWLVGAHGRDGVLDTWSVVLH